MFTLAAVSSSCFPVKVSSAHTNMDQTKKLKFEFWALSFFSLVHVLEFITSTAARHQEAAIVFGFMCITCNGSVHAVEQLQRALAKHGQYSQSQVKVLCKGLMLRFGTLNTTCDATWRHGRLLQRHLTTGSGVFYRNQEKERHGDRYLGFHFLRSKFVLISLLFHLPARHIFIQKNTSKW